MRFSPLPVLLLVCVPSTGCSSLGGLLPAPATSAERLVADVTITRDEWGVPHIVAPTDESAVFALGYAQAEDDFQQMEEDYLHALGRASHWYGEEYLASDLVAAAFEVERHARAEYDREPAERRMLWDAYAAGVNHFIRTSGIRPRLITSLEPWMPFALVRAQSVGASVDGIRLGALSESGAGYQLVGVFDGEPDAGLDAGRAWAMAPSRAAEGHALLLESIYSNFAGPGRPYEFMMVSGEGWHVGGSAVLGTPVPRSGHNDQLAWALTRTNADVADVYAVTFDHPTDPLMYRREGAWHAAVEWEDTLRVNSPAGVTERVFRFRRTEHGPVVAEHEGRALALRAARLQEGGALQQLHAMSRARDLSTFRTALDQRALTAAVTYADTAGNILHLPANVMPVRDSAIDWTRPVDGSTSATAWDGYRPADEIPVLLNPASGMVGSGGPVPQNGDSLWTVDRLRAAAFDSFLPGADEAILTLTTEWEMLGGQDAERARRLDAAIDLLRSWDLNADMDSEPATLFVLWQEQLRSQPYSGDFPRFRALEAVLAGLERHRGTTAVSWGEINRLQRDSAAAGGAGAAPNGLPMGGAPAWAGGMFVFEGEASEPGARRRGIAGHSLIRIVQLGTVPRSRSIVPFGQSADPASRHYFDQAALYARGALKAGRFLKDEVMSAGGRTYRPGDTVRELP